MSREDTDRKALENFEPDYETEPEIPMEKRPYDIREWESLPGVKITKVKTEKK